MKQEYIVTIFVVVVAVIIVLANVKWPTFTMSDPIPKTKMAMSFFDAAISAYRHEFGSYPNSLTNLTESGNVNSIKFINQDDIFDKWNRPIQYKLTPSGYELRSAGPDGVFETPDDIVKSIREPNHRFHATLKPARMNRNVRCEKS